MKTFVFVRFLLAALSLHGAKAKQFNTLWKVVDCSVQDLRNRLFCEDFKHDNTRKIYTCPPSADSCINFTFSISDAGSYTFTLTADGCENGIITGCYLPSQMDGIDSDMEDSLDILKHNIGSNIEDFQVCFCTVDGRWLFVLDLINYTKIGLGSVIALLGVVRFIQECFQT